MICEDIELRQICIHIVLLNTLRKYNDNDTHETQLNIYIIYIYIYFSLSGFLQSRDIIITLKIYSRIKKDRTVTCTPLTNCMYAFAYAHVFIYTINKSGNCTHAFVHEKVLNAKFSYVNLLYAQVMIFDFLRSSYQR